MAVFPGPGSDFLPTMGGRDPLVTCLQWTFEGVQHQKICDWLRRSSVRCLNAVDLQSHILSLNLKHKSCGNSSQSRVNNKRSRFAFQRFRINKTASLFYWNDLFTAPDCKKNPNMVIIHKVLNKLWDLILKLLHRCCSVNSVKYIKSQSVLSPPHDPPISSLLSPQTSPPLLTHPLPQTFLPVPSHLPAPPTHTPVSYTSSPICCEWATLCSSFQAGLVFGFVL